MEDVEFVQKNNVFLNSLGEALSYEPIGIFIKGSIPRKGRTSKKRRDILIGLLFLDVAQTIFHYLQCW